MNLAKILLLGFLIPKLTVAAWWNPWSRKAVGAHAVPVVVPNIQTMVTNASGVVQKLYDVVKVIDGDTLSVSMEGKTETIRLIGVNTPETVDPRKSVECFGREASKKAKELLSGRKVRVENDQSQGTRDKYGRMLVYVYREDGLLVNKYLVEHGYAYEYTYNTPYKFQSEFKAAQKSAETNKRGLWADGVCEVKSPVPQVPIKYNFSNYICAYNAYNCSNFSTHTEAQSVYEACGGAGNDIHRLDQDKDGLACETLP